MTFRQFFSDGNWRRWPGWRFLIAALAIVLILVASLIPWPWAARRVAERYYVPDQIVLTGEPAEIDAVIEAVRADLKLDAAKDIQELSRVSLDYLDQALTQCADVPANAPQLVIAQYGIGGKVPVDRVLRAVQERANDLNLAVTPEPNYLTGRPPVSVTGDPWTVGGSPWTVGGSPWTVGGSPSGEAARAAANQAFLDQWALGERGINLLAASGKGQTLGQGVRIGLFDTSPFPDTIVQVNFAMSTPLTLHLQHPMPAGRLARDPFTADVREHGLFSAGLIHAVAPQSEIQLIRVLDDTGQGDLQTLNRALSDFVADQIGRQGSPNGAVINLSLGIHPPPDAKARGLPDEITSLKIVLSTAKCAGIAIVAAAGNDSADTSVAQPAQIPARWDSALGVAASNDTRQRSCFSNDGQVLAPGGDGGPIPPACKQMLATCTGDCKYALISLSLASPSGYAYWNGTSFAAPLVSGAIARVLGQRQAMGALAVAPTPADGVQQIYDWVTNGVIDGVIDLPSILTP